MSFLAEKSGHSLTSLLPRTETNEYYKQLYKDLPGFDIPGTEFFSESAEAQIPKDKPVSSGRPSTKRKKGVMDFVSSAAYLARHPGE